MASAPILKLACEKRRALLEDLNYLNTAEIKSFCKQHAIPYRIVVETPDGRKWKTADDDRKGVILERIRHFLETGTVLAETCFRAGVVCFDPLPAKISPDDRLFYGQYDKANPAMNALLKVLTKGRFQNGAIARILARKFWARGEAPTFRQFAAAWLRERDEHSRPNAEWAFLSDRTRGDATPGWKKMRAKKAAEAIRVLGQITQ
ncbi:MAG TPA: hypothetical protein VMB03_14500 [Bryobacteraceae bacterium]|nr:hypothetical protein [Bryobacteraceae bacterium]